MHSNPIALLKKPGTIVKYSIILTSSLKGPLNHMITNKLLFTAIALLYGINTSTYYEVKSSKRIRQVNQKEYLNELEGKVHSIPYYGERKIAAKTIQEWLLHYRRNGFEALKPKKRADRGDSRRLSPDDQDHILETRKKSPYMPVSVFYELLIQQGEIQQNQVSYSTINRLLKKHNLVGKQIREFDT